MGYLKKGGKHCFSLVIYKFCGNKALYWAILLFTMFFGPAAVAQQALQNRVCPSFSLSECFLGIGSLVFSKFWHGARNPNEVVPDRTRFVLEKFLLRQTLGTWVKIVPKIELFFEFIKKISLQFSQNLFYNANLYYLLRFCT